MMLVQKPLLFPTTSSSAHNHHQHHRRHPSAPLFVQPTGKPGLLSLSMAKPSTLHSSPQPQQQQAQQRSSNHHQHHRSPKNKPAVAAANKTSPRPAHAEAQGVSKAGKDKITQRSTSPSLPIRRPRQPSPPINILSTSQAKPTSKSNLFDPFVVHSDSDSDTQSHPLPPVVNLNLKLTKASGEVRPTPKLADPSGKLAKRRRHPTVQGTPTPAPSKAVPVPRTHPNGQRNSNNRSGHNNNVNTGRSHTRAHSALMNLSRSAPSASSPSLTTAGAFPICDDTDTTTEDGNDDDVTPPATPIRPRSRPYREAQRYDDGPRTAPLSSTYGSGGFPFGGSIAAVATPSPSQRHGHGHIRAPSEGEGVFNLSFDEDSSASSSSEEWAGASGVAATRAMEREKMKMKMLFGLTPRRMQELRFGHGSSQRKEKEKMKGEKEKASSLYASSLFQNSPSPDDLPPPAF